MEKEVSMKTHSGAYPPDMSADVVSASHIWVKKHLTALQANLRLSFRPLDGKELEDCANLHAEWFPINYTEHFFKEIGSSMLSIAAVISPSDYGDCKTEEILAGLIVFRITPHMTLQYLRFTYLLSDVNSAYIATLGVVEELRSLGIGRELISRCRDYCLSVASRPQFIYLHVAGYNAEAMAFYARVGFSEAEYLRGHYNINGRNYDAFVYILYINGGKPPLLTLANAKHAVVSIWRLPGRLKTRLLG
jgi:ribosomal protein S18 acetylase RimI-like enzyme